MALKKAYLSHTQLQGFERYKVRILRCGVRYKQYNV